MKHTVWLFTRPIKIATGLGVIPLASISDGKDHFRHWGILVSDRTRLDIQAVLLRQRQDGGNDSSDLGTIYELYRDEDNRNNVKVTRPFGTETLRKLRQDWHIVDFQFVGETSMTHETIILEGSPQRVSKMFYLRFEFLLTYSNADRL